MRVVPFIERGFKKLFPAPFTLAVLLSLLAIFLGMFFSEKDGTKGISEILSAWQSGMWEPALLVFAVQMMLILVLGHVLVLSQPVSRLMSSLTKIITSNTSAVLVVSLSAMLASFFNWGLGLIFGAIMARKAGEAAESQGFPINYPLIGAAGYSGLMIWHGGISGSAPLKAAETGHLQSLFTGGPSSGFLAQIPQYIPTEATIFSFSNLLLFGILLLAVPIVLCLAARKAPKEPVEFASNARGAEKAVAQGAEKLDQANWLGILFGIFLFAAFLFSYWENIVKAKLTPNMLNFLMLCLCILMHRNFKSFLKALDEAIVGAAGILIQFPLYFGIMGIMKETGMVDQIATFFAGVASTNSLPIYTFFSAGLVNIFVPSGGGQWAIQGPVILESAAKLGVPFGKAIMAFAYGDQITNMLQPFWALPLLAITGLKARDILPYTLLLMLLGTVIFITGLLLLP